MPINRIVNGKLGHVQNDKKARTVRRTDETAKRTSTAHSQKVKLAATKRSSDEPWRQRQRRKKKNLPGSNWTRQNAFGRRLGRRRRRPYSRRAHSVTNAPRLSPKRISPQPLTCDCGIWSASRSFTGAPSRHGRRLHALSAQQNGRRGRATNRTDVGRVAETFRLADGAAVTASHRRNGGHDSLGTFIGVSVHCVIFISCRSAWSILIVLRDAVLPTSVFGIELPLVIRWLFCLNVFLYFFIEGRHASVLFDWFMSMLVVAAEIVPVHFATWK